jgi:2-phospho-L-lactate guanylyltransferase
MTTVAAVPVKDLVNAKQRLIPLLVPEERRALARAMLDDVLDSLRQAPVDAVYVVTKDPDVAALARQHGFPCLVERANRGHTEAVALAQGVARAGGAGRFLTVPGDVPCITADEVRSLCSALGEGPGVVFVPSLSGFGTNAALLAPPGIMPLKFGEPSFSNHLEAARERGLAPAVLELPGIGLDIDAPEDLALLLERGSGTRSAGVLRELGVPGRLPARR